MAERSSPAADLPSGLIGRRMLRVEDRPLLIGAGAFVDDLALPEMLHASFFRSQLAHARVGAIALDAARTAPGVAGAFAAGDLGLEPLVTPIDNPDAFAPPRPLLASAVARFVGEPLAVVAAESPYQAEDAVELIDAELEPLPPLVDPLAAAQAPPMHDHHDSNVLLDSLLEVGEVDAAFERAAVVVERAFRNPRCCAVPIEPRGLVAAPDGHGLRIWASSQSPYGLATIVAQLLGLPRERVRVTTPDIGGGFGQKAHAYPEDIVVAWLALRLGRPVKWVEDRGENLLASSHARDQHIRVRAAADAEGRLLAVDADIVCDTGAYAVYPHGHILEALGTRAMIPGPYRLENYRARSRAIATNKAPEGAYRGVGMPVSVLVHERLMDVLAAELGMDRAEIRRRNYVPSEAMPYTSVTHQRYDSGDYGLALERALAAIDYAGFAAEQREARSHGRLLGLGLSSYVEYTGMGSQVFHGRGMVAIPGYDQAWIAIDDDGGATVRTTLPAIGQGLATTMAQLASEGLGIPVEQVRVARPDTGEAEGDGTGTFASRSAIAGAGAVAAAAAEMTQRLRDDAAERLEASPADLQVVDGRVAVKGSPSHAVPIAELVRGNAERYRTKAVFDPPETAYPYATHACKVEIDTETGAVQILRYVVAEDCGVIINPLIVEGQAHGAVAQGIGAALYESLVYDSAGQLLTASLMDYLVPTAVEVPGIELEHLEIPAPGTPNGAKGVGEGGTLAPPAALANAVSDALGAEMNELPLTPERVHAAAADVLRTARRSQAR